MVHDFVPRFYFVEPPDHDERWETMVHLLEFRKMNYAKTQFICDYKLWQYKEMKRPLTSIPPQIIENMYFYSPYYLRVSNAILIALILWYWRLFKVRQGKLESIIHHRATLSALIMFSVFAGYKEIVLVGVDLNTPYYFWETSPAITHPFKPSNAQPGQVHMTADPELSLRNKAIPIDQYVDLVERIILRPRGISLFIASDKSRLYPRLRKYIFPVQR
jgi:hypothetical protein